MALRRADNVFLLTLVDFLVQIIFFGLLVFVFFTEAQRKEQATNSPEKIRAAIAAAGVSNIVELEDELSKLAPVQLKDLNKSLGAGKADVDLAKTIEAIEKAGGAQKLPDALDRLAKLEQGAGKSPCIYQSLDGRKQARTLATAVGSGSMITFQSETPDLARLLQTRGLRYSDVQSLSFSQFRRTFSRVVEAEPNCRYTIEFRETTRLVDARDAAGSIFYLRLRR